MSAINRSNFSRPSWYTSTRLSSLSRAPSSLTSSSTTWVWRRATSFVGTSVPVVSARVCSLVSSS